MGRGVLFAQVAALLSMVWLAGAERRDLSTSSRRMASMGLSSLDANPGGRRKGQSLRSRAALAFLSSLAIPAQAGDVDLEQVDTVTREMFQQFDTDTSGTVSHREFMERLPEPDVMMPTSWSGIFLQADIDDDDLLSLPEFEFAGYLVNHGAVEQRFEHFALRDTFDGMFEYLRTSFEGRVSFDDLAMGFITVFEFWDDGAVGLDALLGIDTYGTLQTLFGRADIIQDGTLNLNELDFFKFLLLDTLAFTAAKEDMFLQYPEMLHRETTSTDEVAEAAGSIKTARSAQSKPSAQAIADLKWSSSGSGNNR
mmetsp:Transcript_37961/g.109194  ORF Transcript_37961/g.109194 Transcript_37961/m.109194 type:complete len:310 (-) Transcript_37961:150-1079(-)